MQLIDIFSALCCILNLNLFFILDVIFMIQELIIYSHKHCFNPLLNMCEDPL